VEAIKRGAFDYLQKPIKTEKLLQTVRNALKISRLEKENSLLRRNAPGEEGKLIVTESPELQATLVRAKKLALSQPPEPDQAVIDTLCAYDWPGNVRELQGAIAYACTVCEGPVLRIGDLPNPVAVGKNRQSGSGRPLEQAEMACIARVLSGIVQPDEGNILWKGRGRYLPDVNTSRNLGIEMVPQDNELFNYQSVANNIFINQPALFHRGFFNPNKIIAAAEEVLSAMDVSIPARKKAADLALPERVLIDIIRHLYPKPDLLILDEALEKLAAADLIRVRKQLRRLVSGGSWLPGSPTKSIILWKQGGGRYRNHRSQ
jgi:ABC-type iron transport system FetAB ATPase subunit